MMTEGGVGVETDAGVPILIAADWLVRFTSAPTHEPLGIRWRVSFGIEVMP
jgi:hypothetical protein